MTPNKARKYFEKLRDRANTRAALLRREADTTKDGALRRQLENEAAEWQEKAKSYQERLEKIK